MLSVLLNSPANTTINYLPIVIQLVVAIGFVAFMMSVTHLLGPKRRTSDKLANFESGRDPVCKRQLLANRSERRVGKRFVIHYTAIQNRCAEEASFHRGAGRKS